MGVVSTREKLTDRNTNTQTHKPQIVIYRHREYIQNKVNPSNVTLGCFTM